MSDIKDSPDNYFPSPSDMWGEYETYQTIPACGMAQTTKSGARWTELLYIIGDLKEGKPDYSPLTNDQWRENAAKMIAKAATDYRDALLEESGEGAKDTLVRDIINRKKS